MFQINLRMDRDPFVPQPLGIPQSTLPMAVKTAELLDLLLPTTESINWDEISLGSHSLTSH